MAPKNSKTSSKSSSEEKQLREFMEMMNEQGRTSEVLNIIRENFGSQPQEPDNQGMSDASKRRRDTATAWDEAIFVEPSSTAASSSGAGGGYQAPVAPARSSNTEVVRETLVNPSVRSSGPALPAGVRSLEEWGRTIIQDTPNALLPPAGRILLPEGIQSLEEWGRTVCKLPKVAKLDMTYRELANLGHHDQDIYNYLTRFVMNHNGTSGKVHDLRRYLIAIDFKRESPLTYAPSSLKSRTVRE